MFSLFSSLSSMSNKNIILESLGNIWIKKTDSVAQGYTLGNLYNYSSIDSIRTSYDGQYIYVVCQPDKKVLRSSNYGNSWNSITSTQIPSLSTNISRGIAVSSTGQYVYLGSTTGVILMSSDYGVNWSQITSSSTNITSIDCSSDGSKIIYHRQSNSIMLGTNFGATHTQISSTALALATIQQKTYNVCMSPDGSKIAVLVNTWSNTTVANVGVYISSNGGTSFNNIWTGGEMWMSDIYLNDAGDFWASSGYGINQGCYIYKVSTGLWDRPIFPFNNAYSNITVGGCSSDFQKMIICNRQTNYDYIWFSKDGGINWTRATTFGRSTWQSSAVSPDGKMFIASGINTRGDLYIST